MKKPATEYQKGILLVIACYTIWGSFPLYWYPLQGMDAYQIMAQRVLWSFLFLLGVVTFTGQIKVVLHGLTNRRIFVTFLGASFFIFFNWLTYLWAISNNHVLDASLGYYMNPLVSIFLGRIFLKEYLSRPQYIAIGIATLGVLWLAILGKSIPIVAIILATSFGFYGLIKRVASLPTIPGLTLETLFMMPYSIVYLAIVINKGELQLFNLDTIPLLVLLFSGAVTTIPLVLFSEGARRIPLSLVGIFQYISPTFQLLMGIFLFKETFSANRFVGFALVWVAIAVFLYGEWRKKHPKGGKAAL